MNGRPGQGHVRTNTSSELAYALTGEPEVSHHYGQGNTSKDDLLGDIDGETGRVPVSGVLDGVRGKVVAGAGEEDPRDSGVREDGEVGPWWEGVDVSRTRVRTRPVRGVDGRGSNESTPTLSTVGVGRHRDTNVLEGGRPVTDDRDDAVRKENNEISKLREETRPRTILGTTHEGGSCSGTAP